MSLTIYSDRLLYGLLTEALASLREDDVGCPPWDTQCDKHTGRTCTRHALVDRIEEALYPSEVATSADLVVAVGTRIANLGFFFCGRCSAEVRRDEAVRGDITAICRACAGEPT